MNDVTDNAKNNFGDPLDAMYIACARSVSENVGLLLRNLYVVSYKFDLVLFRGNAFCPPLTFNCNGFFWYSKKGGSGPPSGSAYVAELPADADRRLRVGVYV